MREERASFSVWQNGVKVAFGSGPAEATIAEGRHYAAVFAQDGPVDLRLRRIPPLASPAPDAPYG